MRSLQSQSSLSLGLFLALGGSACSLAGRDGGSSIYVDLTSLAHSSASRFSLTELAGGPGLTSLGAPPTSATGFQCYAVNVTGPGIGDSSPNGSKEDPMIGFPALLRRENFCSYRGVITPTLNIGSQNEVALQVPPGGVRLVQLVGVNDPLVCASGVVNDPPGANSNYGAYSRYYEVGRAVLTDVFGDRSVNLQMDWPAVATDQAARRMDCGDGSCTVVDHYLGSVANFAGPTATFPSYGQRIVSEPGKYLKAVDLSLKVTTAANVTVDIYESPAGNASPVTLTAYSRTLALPAAAVESSVIFELGSPGNFLQMQSGIDYWIVLTSDQLGGTSSWQFNSGTSPNTVRYTSGAWQSHSTNAGFNYRIRSCGN